MKNTTLLFFFLTCFLVVESNGQETKTENIFIITYDGLRWQELFSGADSMLIGRKQYVEDSVALKNQFWANTPEERRKKLMPFFWSVISEQGQLLGNRSFGNNINCSNGMWFSYPGYNEILCGFADDKNINSNDKNSNPNKTILELLNADPKFKGKVAAFGSWDFFPFIINEERSGVPVNAGFKSVIDKDASQREIFLNELQEQIPSPFTGVRLDAFTHHFALEYLKRKTPQVVYISYGETDDFAHAGKYDAYLKSAKQTDQFIKELWTWVQSHPRYKNKTTFLITTDHGRGTVPVDSWRSHGTKVNGSDQIWIAAIGPDVAPVGEARTPIQLYQNQVAATAASLLGFTMPQDKRIGAPFTKILTTRVQAR